MASGSTATMPTAASIEAEAKQIMINLDKPQGRTIRAAEYLSVKRVMPKTFVGHTIIHENPSQNRLLEMELNRIGHRKSCYLSSHEISRRTFLEQKTRKERKWKSQDEMRISGMNFPTLRASAISGRASVEVMYKSPKYSDGEGTQQTETMLPYMRIRRERTEFIRRKGTIATTKLPTVVEIDGYKLQRYNTFCGNDFKRLRSRKVQRDKKFTLLMDSLAPLKLEEDEEGEGDNKRPESVDRSKPWYMSDSDSDSDSEIPIRGLSRDSKRKAVVVFPSVTRRSNAVRDKYAAPIQSPLASTRRPSMDQRAQTQYNIDKPTKELLRLDSIAELKKHNFPLPKTAPEMSNPPTERGTQSPRKSVNLERGLRTELDLVKGKSVGQDKVVKSILKPPSKTKRPRTKDSQNAKREKIRKDLQSKDLKDLKEKYGALKSSAGKEGRRMPTEKTTPVDPRAENQFHSPTLDRRFKVKSGSKHG